MAYNIKASLHSGSPRLPIHSHKPTYCVSFQLVATTLRRNPQAEIIIMSEQSISLLVTRHGARPERRTKYWWMDEPTAFMLVLQRSSREEGAFERIGWAEYLGETPFAGYTGSWEPSQIKII